jgi:hypothetical protein
MPSVGDPFVQRGTCSLNALKVLKFNFQEILSNLTTTTIFYLVDIFFKIDVSSEDMYHFSAIPLQYFVCRKFGCIESVA